MYHYITRCIETFYRVTDDYTSTPNAVNKCAKKNGFTPEPGEQKSPSYNGNKSSVALEMEINMYVGVGIFAVICLLAEPCGVVAGSSALAYSASK